MLSVVVPTRNESRNVAALAAGLDKTLAEVPGNWELIFVDDSDDDTPDVVRHLAGTETGRVHLVHRELGARPGGLGGAVKAGFECARGEIMVVMDGDLQHPPSVVPDLIAPLLSGRADLVAGSRYGGQGSAAGLHGYWRLCVSRFCRWLAHRAVPASRPLEDPLGGLFAFRRSVVEQAQLRPDGYKVLLEVAVRGQWSTASNVAYVFGERHAGASKANLRQGLVFLRHLAKLFLVRRGSQEAVEPGLSSAPAPRRVVAPSASENARLFELLACYNIRSL